MIKIKHAVTIKIGEQAFCIVVNRLNAEQQKKIDLIAKEHTDLIETASTLEKEITALSIDISEKEGSLETNLALLKLEDISLKDRLTLLWENKNLVSKLAELKKNRMSLVRPDYLKSYELIEKMCKERFNAAIEENDQKQALLTYMVNQAVTYSEIFDEINQQIKEDDKKKLNASEDGQSK